MGRGEGGGGDGENAAQSPGIPASEDVALV